MSDPLGRLHDNLSADLAWRKKEIVGLRAAAKRSVARAYMCRAGVVLICAHWEGFLRSSVQHYVHFVFSQGLTVRQLSPGFVAIAIFKDVKVAAEAEFPGSEMHCMKFARRILEGIDVVAPKPKWKVDTGGNPGSTRTAQLLSTIGVDIKLGMDEAGWAATKTFLDEQVLKDRHKIAHGEGLPIDHEDLQGRSERVLGMCESLKSSIMTAASKETYLARSP